MNLNITNIHIWKISELSQAIKSTVEENFEYVRVRGEISRPSFPSSGHIYFSLKDDKALLNAIIWKFSSNLIDLKPEEGLEVICTGKLTTFPGGSKYQIIVQSMVHAGEGALLKQLEQKRKQLYNEGFFDDKLKKSLPMAPKCIGVITSPSGAVIKDILHRIKERWPCKIIIWPVPVQGTLSAEKIANAINQFNKIPDNQKYKSTPDVIIVARGGGSVEDLWSFNEENLVRAVARSRIPIISAVGHETDTTLIDYAADLRAPTPTAAAELATPIKSQMNSKVYETEIRIQRSLIKIFDSSNSKVNLISKLISKSESLFQEPLQNLDLVFSKLQGKALDFLSDKNIFFYKLKSRLPSQVQLIESNNLKLQKIIDNLRQILINLMNKKIINITKIDSKLNVKNIEYKINMNSFKITRYNRNLKNLFLAIFDIKDSKLININILLEASNINKILEKGYVLVKNEKKEIITLSEKLSLGQRIELVFSDGIISSTVNKKD